MAPRGHRSFSSCISRRRLPGWWEVRAIITLYLAMLSYWVGDCLRPSHDLKKTLSVVDFSELRFKVTTADVYPASLRGLIDHRREPRWIFARFHLNDGVGRSHAGPDTRFGKRRR
jgi:hypothetical protein